MVVARVFYLLIRLSQGNHRQSHSPMYKQHQWAHAMAYLEKKKTTVRIFNSLFLNLSAKLKRQRTSTCISETLG